MPLRDLALMALVCLVWGMNNVISKIVVSELGVPPLFYAVARSAIIVLAVAPWLLPVPKPAWRTVVVGMLMGGGSFALLFVGLKTATPSAAAVVSQLGVPMVTLLSIVVLGEHIRWRRGLGIVLAFAGVLVVMWHPGGFTASTGLLFVAGSAFSGAAGVVMMKQMEGIRPLRFQAWVGLSTFLLCGALSLVFERDQLPLALAAGWPFLWLVLFSALVTSVFAHTCYYGLIQRYEANLIAPLTLMAPLFTIALGVLITRDPFGMRMVVGSAVALLGVLIIAVRPNAVMPRAVAIQSSPE
jgi:drug/metabolite transporter (DMT)-like permease